MSITSIDQAIAGMLPICTFLKTAPGTPVIGSMYSLWLAAGCPGAGGLPTGNKAGQFYTCAAAQIAGQLPFTNPAAGDTTYLARFSANANTTGSLILADRIWGDSLSATAIGPQTIYSGAFPRSSGIGAGDSSGTGICLALEVYTALGAGTPTPKVTYINSAGTGDTGAACMAVPATAAIGTFIPINLKSGAFGVRSVTAYNNLVTHTSGCFGLVAYRPLAQIQCISPGVADWVDCLTSGFPILFNNTVPFLIWVAGTVTIPITFGNLVLCQG